MWQERSDEVVPQFSQVSFALNSLGSCIYQLVSRANLALLYRSLCVALIEAVNNKLTRSAPTSVQLRVFEKSTVLLQLLADIVGFVNIPRNYAIFLKVSFISARIEMLN